MEPSSKSKRRRGQNGERCTCSHGAKREKHLYLVLDDWKGGYSIHKLDADNMEDHLPEAASLRLAAPERTPMAFAALGTNIFFCTNTHCSRHQAPPFLVYDTATAALSVGPRPPDGYLRDLGDAVAVGEKLYALTLVGDELCPSTSLQVLSWAPTETADRLEAWDPTMAWLWNSAPTTPPSMADAGDVITSYCLHPDGRTIFMSTAWRTHAVDTSNGVWRDLGEWRLPFRGRAYFDDGLDAWVGLCREHDGYVCCCTVGSRSATATQQPECWMLKEKLFGRGDDGKRRRRLGATLTYMGDSYFCLVENVLRSEDALDAVTLFGLKYDRKGELQTKTRRTTKSYALSKNTTLFAHAAFWM